MSLWYVVLGVQLFGWLQKIMMLPPPSFELATNWLLEVLWIGPPKKSPSSLCESRNVKCKAWAQNVTVLDFLDKFTAAIFGGLRSTFKSQLVAISKLVINYYYQSCFWFLIHLHVVHYLCLITDTDRYFIQVQVF